MTFEGLTSEFAEEALGLLDDLERALVALGVAQDRAVRAPLAASSRRLLHTLKGNAGFVGASPLQAAVHAMEDLAAGAEDVPAAAAALLAALDVVRAEVRAIGLGRSPAEAGEGVLALARDALAAPAAAAARAPSAWNGVRVPQPRLDELIAISGDLSVQNAQLQRLLADAQGSDRRAVRAAADRLDAAARSLRELVLRVRMLPVRELFARFDRLVQDEARRCGLRAALRLSSEDVEVDKVVLDRLTGPLGHLLRNAVAHGLESPEARRAAGKAEEGTITLGARAHGSRVAIHVSDDGRGLEVDRIRGRARELGLDPHADPEALIFEPGFSTAPLSETAGRGVGLEVVAREVTRLGGQVRVESIAGAGTTFELVVPASVALQRALLVEVRGETFAVPMAAVEEAVPLRSPQIRWLGHGSALELRGGLLPLVPPEAIGLGDGAANGQGYALVLSGGGRAALRVDALRGQQDFVFQAVEWAQDSAVSGAALMGDGRVVLRLDPETLVRRAGATPAEEARA